MNGYRSYERGLFQFKAKMREISAVQATPPLNRLRGIRCASRILDLSYALRAFCSKTAKIRRRRRVTRKRNLKSKFCKRQSIFLEILGYAYFFSERFSRFHIQQGVLNVKSRESGK